MSKYPHFMTQKTGKIEKGDKLLTNDAEEKNHWLRVNKY
jgi:hypothetical protein